MLVLSTLVAHADEIVLDNLSPGVQVSGAWTSAALTAGFSGSDYLYRPGSSGEATVFWPFPSSSPTGRYDVYARWTSGPNRASNAPYWISSDDGTVSVMRNQQTGGGDWQLLGTFAFTAGKSEGVTLSDKADGVVVADSLRFVTASATPAPAPAPTPATADANGVWTVALDDLDLHAGPDAKSAVLASLAQFSYLQVLGYSGDWAYVYNPRARGTAYAPSKALGPSDPPPAWVTASPPQPEAKIEQWGRTVGSSPVAYYPIEDTFAYTTRLGHNQPILVHDKVRGTDGSTWYRVDQGYLAAASVRLPKTPERTFSGRWIDADLSEPAMLVAYDGDKPIMSTLAIKGRIADQTPTGVFTIGRRVEDETMDSGTLLPPIDPQGPGGYHLEHVKYTQYFTADGASIHYNYWSSNFGYSGSHGCLGVDLTAAEFLWNWADLGTPVVIHT